MSAGFALVFLVGLGIPLGILYALFGRAGGKPVVVARRASLAAIPHIAAARAMFEPERVFAHEQQLLRENARKVARIVPRGPAAPPPLPRRQVRGTDVTAFRQDTDRSADTEDATNPFVQEDPTRFDDLDETNTAVRVRAR